MLLTPAELQLGYRCYNLQEKKKKGKKGWQRLNKINSVTAQQLEFPPATWKSCYKPLEIWFQKSKVNALSQPS